MKRETLTMSLSERDRLGLLRQVRDSRMNLKEAAEQLGLSYRQAKRLWKRYREVGDAGLIHQLRGRPGNNVAASEARRERAVALCRQHYPSFGPTLAAEQLSQRHELVVDHETLRRWLIAAGLWKPGRQPVRRHRRRQRRACFGELVQLDGSDHHWFGGDRPRCTLMVMIDDATGRIEARFFEAETSVASMTIFQHWARRFGLPRTLYPDRHSIYRRNDKQADEIAHRTGRRPRTRFGEAMDDLGVKLTSARSPQAKGRVERANGTLQDRLVKLMKLDGITDIQQANEYLEQTFLPTYNAKFMVVPAEAADVHRPVAEAELVAALCPVRERRVVDKTGCVSWQGRWFELHGVDASPRRRREVLVRQRLDGQVELLALDAQRVLESRELSERAVKAPTARSPLAERVAGRSGPSKPSADHPWRRSQAAGGVAPARCARLHDATSPEPPRGQFYRVETGDTST